MRGWLAIAVRLPLVPIALVGMVALLATVAVAKAWAWLRR